MHSLSITVRKRLAVEYEDAEKWPLEWAAVTTDVAGGGPSEMATGLGACVAGTAAARLLGGDATRRAVFTCDVSRHASADLDLDRLRNAVRFALLAVR